MNDATAAGRRGGSPMACPAGNGIAAPMSRRHALRLAVALPVATTVLAACSRPGEDDGPDPLIALADAARADAALAAAAVAADPALAARIGPLRAARTEHAAALDAEVVRLGGAPGSATPTAAAPSADARAPGPAAATAVTVAQVRDALAASQRGAADLVPVLPTDRVGLVASVAACCATYAAVLA